MTNKQYIIGVELGGTNITVAILDSEGVVVAKKKKTTMVTLGQQKVIERIIGLIDEAVESANITIIQVKGIGFSSPGLLDLDNGIVIASSNLTGWENVPLKNIMKEKYNIPIFVGHDAAMAALGEKWYGAGIGVNNLVCATVGTGIGIGIIIDGKLYERSTGDFGHMVIDRNGSLCNCGRYGCLERLAGGPQIVASAVVCSQVKEDHCANAK